MTKLPLRPIRVVGTAAYVTLTHGFEAIIDAEDIDDVAQHNWFANPWGGGVYAMRRQWRPGRSPLTIMLHRAILRPRNGIVVDHINGDGLDNRRSNLRLATVQENNFNQRIGARNKSGFKGVHWDREKGAWRAMISAQGRRCHIGYFERPEEAHRAYMIEARRLFGEFARAA